MRFVTLSCALSMVSFREVRIVANSKSDNVSTKTTKGLRKAGVASRDAANEDRVQKSDQALKKLAGTVIRNDTRPRDVRGVAKSPTFSKEVLRGPLPKIVYCDCNIFDPAAGDIANALCGCGKRHLRLYRDEVIHWRGTHWKLECAFRFASTFVPPQTEKTKPRSPRTIAGRRSQPESQTKRRTR